MDSVQQGGDLSLDNVRTLYSNESHCDVSSVDSVRLLNLSETETELLRNDWDSSLKVLKF